MANKLLDTGTPNTCCHLQAKALRLVLTLLIGLSAFISTTTGEAQAQSAAPCKCKAKPGLDSEFDNSSLVFVGRIAEQRVNPMKPSHKESRVTVFKKFKGFEELPTTEYITIYSQKETSNCGYNFQNGFEYLIFASGTPAFFEVDSCGRTELLDKSMLDQERLVRLIEKRNAEAATERPISRERR